MLCRALCITCFLLLKLSVNSAASNNDNNPQDDVKNYDQSGMNLETQLKELLQGPVKTQLFQSQANTRGFRYDNDIESKLKIWLNWLKMRASAMHPSTTRPTAVQNSARITQLAEILQKNDEAVQKIDSVILNSQAYTTIVQNLLALLEKDLGLVNENVKAPEKSWNNNLIARFIENMLEVSESGNSQHMTIQILRTLLRSIDRNLERLDKVITPPEGFKMT